MIIKKQGMQQTLRISPAATLCLFIEIVMSII